MGVTGIVVTRGDVPLAPVLDSLPPEWEVVLWSNAETSTGRETIVRRWPKNTVRSDHYAVETRLGMADLAVYGRYAAIEYASHDLIYAADDDVIVSDPQAIVEAWLEAEAFSQAEHVGDPQGFVVCNVPPEFRHDFYREHALVGFGAAFHRDAPERAFERFAQVWGGRDDGPMPEPRFFNRTCDVVFTTLAPRVLVDVPKENLPYAEGPDRMYRQPEHTGERARMLALALQVRDA